jgi:hypothetical protein
MSCRKTACIDVNIAAGRPAKAETVTTAGTPSIAGTPATAVTLATQG